MRVREMAGLVDRRSVLASSAALLLAVDASVVAAQGSAEENLRRKNITLPQVATPAANYVRAVRTGNLLFLSGSGPGNAAPRGKLGADLTVEQGYQAARATGLVLLANLRDAVGSLDKVKRIVKVLGMVNSTPEFTDQPRVINGFSDLMVEVFGEAKGKHARSAVGMAALPGNIPVEIEMIVELEPEP